MVLSNLDVLTDGVLGGGDDGDGEETRVSREAPQVAQKSVSDGYVLLQNQVGVGRKTNNRQIKAVYSAREVGSDVPGT